MIVKIVLDLGSILIAWVCYFVNLKRNIIPVSLYLYHYSEIQK